MYVSRYDIISVYMYIIYIYLNIYKTYSLRHVDCFLFFNIVNNNLSLIWAALTTWLV